MKISSIISRLIAPLCLLAFAFLLFILWRLLQLPSQDEMIVIAEEYFNTYGLIFVFVSAIIEGLILAGWYYPGSLVIFLGVIFAGQDIKRIGLVVLVVTLGLLIAYAANYFIGKHGWYRLLLKFGLRKSLERAETNLRRLGTRAIFMTYWQPSFASLTATAAGILKLPFVAFIAYSISAALLWNSFWALIIHLLGERTLSIIGFRFLLVFSLSWIVYELVAMKYKKAMNEKRGHIDF